MKVTRYEIKGAKLKAAVVADMHGVFNRNAIGILKNEKPDVILIPGDLASVGSYEDIQESYMVKEKKGQEQALEFLKSAACIAPVFYSLGNHEWGCNDEYREKVRETGTILLENEWAQFGDVWIGGQNSAKCYMEDFRIEERKIPDRQWLTEKKPEGYRILLCHHPEYYHMVKDYADLVISGHAHGGQWRFFGRGVFAPGQGLFPKYSRGQYDKMIVSAGLTNTTWIPRLFNSTELVIVELE